MARELGFEPRTDRLTVDCSTAELLPNILLYKLSWLFYQSFTFLSTPKMWKQNPIYLQFGRFYKFFRIFLSFFHLTKYKIKGARNL